jgi:hypothetical protein
MGKPVKLTGNYKRGSTWTIRHTATDDAGVAEDWTDAIPRVMFRTESVDGTILLTLTLADGLSIPTPANGETIITLTPLQTVLFPVGTKVYIDIEFTRADTTVWQSSTYYLVAEQEVTRDV